MPDLASWVDDYLTPLLDSFKGDVVDFLADQARYIIERAPLCAGDGKAVALARLLLDTLVRHLVLCAGVVAV